MWGRRVLYDANKGWWAILNLSISRLEWECMRVTNAVSVIQTKTPNIQVNPIVDL